MFRYEHGCMKRHLVRAGAVVAALALGWGMYAIGADPVTAIGLVFVAAVAALLTAEYRDYLPTSDDWAVSRWSGVFIGVTMLGTFFGLNNGLGITPETTLALQLLVLGLAWNGMLFGVVMATEQRRLEEGEDASPA